MSNVIVQCEVPQTSNQLVFKKHIQGSCCCHARAARGQTNSKVKAPATSTVWGHFLRLARYKALVPASIPTPRRNMPSSPSMKSPPLLSTPPLTGDPLTNTSKAVGVVRVEGSIGPAAPIVGSARSAGGVPGAGSSTYTSSMAEREVAGLLPSELSTESVTSARPLQNEQYLNFQRTRRHTVPCRLSYRLIHQQRRQGRNHGHEICQVTLFYQLVSLG